MLCSNFAANIRKHTFKLKNKKMNAFDIELKKYFEAKDKLAIFYKSKKYSDFKAELNLIKKPKTKKTV
jgi:uncharacterized ubiquitin-like protein YukD